jgi:cell wall-associated NlpC family hydrolase
MVDVIRRRRPALAMFAVTVMAMLLGVLPQAARADQISDKQAQANAIAAKIDQLNGTIERYAEAANGAQVELDGLNQQVADAQTKVDAAQAQLEQHQSEIRSYAVDAYVHGTPDQSAALSTTTDLNDLGQRQGYLNAAAGNRQTLIDQLRATQEDVRIQISQLNDAKAKAEAKKKDLDNQKASAQAAVDQQNQLYHQAQGELASLVKAAQDKKAADDAAAASARLKQAPPKDISTGPPPSVNGGAGAAIAEAKKQLGKPYSWGAAGPDSFDCSGLTMWSWRAGGVNLPHYTGSQYASTTHIPLSAIQPGDLIFYNGMEHVALYIGGGQIIHAPHSGSVVQIENMYYWNTSMVASRP